PSAPSSLPFFINPPPTTKHYTLSLHDALPILAAWLDSRAAERLRVVRLDPQLGFGAAANAGIEAAVAEVCVLFDTSIELTGDARSEEHTSELQSLAYLVCRLLLEKKKFLFAQE